MLMGRFPTYNSVVIKKSFFVELLLSDRSQASGFKPSVNFPLKIYHVLKNNRKTNQQDNVPQFQLNAIVV